MSLFDKEEVVAPTVAAVVASVVSSSATCTRDTRGNADCAVKNCENCS